MDTYEDFMNDYCDFMEEYQDADASDLAEMTKDYAEMSTKYAEQTKKIQAIDEKSLSSADLVYYTEVMGRVNTRIAELGTSMQK